MTVINPNSVAGINSITVASGNALSVHKSDGTLIRTITESSGISTFTSISVGSATTTNNADKSINIGLGASISQHAVNSLSFGTVGTERVKITASGNLEMPNDNDYIKIGAGGDLQFVHTGSSSVINNGTGFLEIQSDGTTFELADGTEKARFDSSGRLLIGTVTEGHSNADDLTVATSGNTGITIRSGTTSGGNIFFSDATSGTGEYSGMISYDHNDNIMTFATGDGSERIRITTDGRILMGIGSTSNIATNSALTIKNTSNSSATRFNLVNTGSSQPESTQIYSQNNDLAFVAGATERLRINSDGDINVSTAATIKANGNATFSGIATAASFKVSDTVGPAGFSAGNNDDLQLYHDGSASRIHSGSHPLYMRSGGQFGVFKGDGSESMIVAEVDAEVKLYHNNVKKLETASHGITVSGEIRDDRGNLRDIQSEPLSGTHSSRTLVAADAGKVVIMSGGVTLPAASQSGPFGGGSTLTILNKSGSAITLTQGTGLTLYNTADATTGNRTLAARGIATVYYMYGGNEAYISGSGLS